MIPAVLVYVQCGAFTLMIHRNGSEGKDFHSGKWNGLGGKFELDEIALETARREVLEESGLEIPLSEFQALGTLHFPNFKPHKQEDWMVFVFVAKLGSTESPPTVHSQISEGELHWVPSTDLLKLNLWPGDRHFLPWVMKGTPFMGTLCYKGGDVDRFWVQALSQSQG